MPFFKRFLIWWFVLLVISIFTASNSIRFFERLFYSCIMAVIALFLSIINNKGSNSSASSKIPKHQNTYTSSVRNKSPVIYVYEGFSRQYKYRIENNHIFEGYSSSFSYSIIDNKIYKGIGGGKFLYRIEPHKYGDGQRVYEGLSNQPAFKVVDNKVYRGEFGNHVLYRLSDSPTGMTHYTV